MKNKLITMRDFHKFRRLLIVIILGLIIYVFTEINYHNLSFQENKTEYISIVSSSLMILALYFSNRIEMKKNS